MLSLCYLSITAAYLSIVSTTPRCPPYSSSREELTPHLWTRRPREGVRLEQRGSRGLRLSVLSVGLQGGLRQSHSRFNPFCSVLLSFPLLQGCWSYKPLNPTSGLATAFKKPSQQRLLVLSVSVCVCASVSVCAHVQTCEHVTVCVCNHVCVCMCEWN